MSNLSVAITADVADLEAKLALARSALRDATAEMRSQATAARAAGATTSGTLAPALVTAAGAAAKAKAEVAALQGKLESAGGAASSFRERISLAGKGLDSLRLRISEYTSLASKFGELLVVGFAGERVAEMVNSTAEMGEQLLKLSRATGISTDTLSRWHYTAQQLGIDTETIDTGVVRLAKSIQQALMSPTSAAAQSFNALGLSQDYLREHSNDLQTVMLKVSDSLRTAHGGGQALSAVLNIMGRSAADMVPFLQQGSDGLARFGEEADRLGVTIGQQQAEEMEKYDQSVKRLSASWEGFKIAITTDVVPALSMLLDALVEGEHALGRFIGWLDQLGVGSASAVSAQISEITAQIIALKQAMAGESGISHWIDSQKLENLERRLDILKKKLALTPSGLAGSAVGSNLALGMKTPQQLGDVGNLKDNTAYDDVRIQYEKMKAEWAANHDEMLRKSVEFWDGVIKNAKEFNSLDATQQKEVWSQYYSALAALRARDGSEAAAAAKKKASDEATIARDQTNTAIELSRIKLQSESDTLQAEVDAGKITNTQKIAALSDLANKEYTINAARLQDELATLTQGTTAWQAAFDKIQILQAQHAAQIAVEQKKAAQDSAKVWTDAGNVITRSFDQVLTGILRGTQTWQQAMMRLLSDLIIAAIEWVAKLGVQWAVNETRMTVASLMGNAQRTASNQLGQTSFLAQIAQRLTQWLGFETASTAATVAGNATKTASDATTFAVSSAIDVARGMAAISISAAEAAAAAFADSAMLGPVGLAAAPGVAAAAYASTMGWAAGMGVGSAAGGMWEVPGTILSILHPEESVIPAAVANPMRDFFSSGSGSGGGGANLNVTAVDAKGVHALLSNPTTLRWLARNIGAYQATNPSTRGAY